MARILLVIPNETREPYPVYPLGASIVAHGARSRGHDVREWDYLFETSRGGTLAEAVAEHQPDVIGVSLRNIDNINMVNQELYVDWYLAVVQELKELTDRPVVVGGAGFSLMPERMLEFLGADYGVVGEGEQVFSDLAERLAAGERPEQRLYAGEKPIDGEQLVVTGRDPDLAAYYFANGGMLNVQSKRGCPLRCAYCTYPLLEGRTFRFRDPADVVAEIARMKSEHGADYFAFTDSTFNDPQGKYLEVAEELLRRRVKVRLMAFFRPDHFQKDQVDLLRRAGLHSVEWGSDCSTDTTLRAMRKSFRWDQVMESNRLFAEAGVKNAHFIIFGGPGETEQTVTEGLANIERLSESVVFVFQGVRILPRTAVHQIALEEGVVSEDDDLLRPVYYTSKHVSGEFIHQALLASFGSRMDRIYPIPTGSEKVARLYEMGLRGPAWDLLLFSGGSKSRGDGASSR